MTCEICGEDREGVIVLLPIRQPDGKLVTFACLPCAQKSHAYCQAHVAPHTGFADETTACMRCIEEEVARQADRADEICQRLVHALPAAHVAVLARWAAGVHILTGMPADISLLRTVITRAKRMHTSIGQVVDEVVEGKSVASILPPEFVTEASS